MKNVINVGKRFHEEQLRKLREALDRVDRANLRGPIDDAIRRVEAAKARERQARLDRKVAPISEYKKK